MKIHSNVFLASDHHFNHDQSFIYHSRGFDSIAEHDAALVEAHNSVVGDDDPVLFLGDTFLADLETALKSLSQLRGRIHFIRGNHTTDNRVKAMLALGWIQEPEVIVQYWHGLELALSHFPFDITQSRYNAHTFLHNIHGHTHKTDIYYRPYSYNISMDALPDYKPIRLKELLDGKD